MEPSTAEPSKASVANGGDARGGSKASQRTSPTAAAPAGAAEGAAGTSAAAASLHAPGTLAEAPAGPRAAQNDADMFGDDALGWSSAPLLAAAIAANAMGGDAPSTATAAQDAQPPASLAAGAATLDAAASLAGGAAALPPAGARKQRRRQIDPALRDALQQGLLLPGVVPGATEAAPGAAAAAPSAAGTAGEPAAGAARPRREVNKRKFENIMAMERSGLHEDFDFEDSPGASDADEPRARAWEVRRCTSQQHVFILADCRVYSKLLTVMQASLERCNVADTIHPLISVLLKMIYCVAQRSAAKARSQQRPADYYGRAGQYAAGEEPVGYQPRAGGGLEGDAGALDFHRTARAAGASGYPRGEQQCRFSRASCRTRFSFHAVLHVC